MKEVQLPVWRSQDDADQIIRTMRLELAELRQENVQLRAELAGFRARERDEC